MSNFDGKHGEIANQSGVVIQTTHDIKDMVNRMRVNEDTSYIYRGAVRTLDTATVRININDLVFRAGTSKAPRQNLLNNAIEVTSNLNGFAINKKRVKGFVKDVNNPTEEEILQAISESIRFIGQALGATVPNPENEEDQKLQFTTRVQGTGHILNTGSAQLSPGDTLYWDLFTEAEVKSDAFKKRLTRFGFGAKTVPLKTVPMSAAHSGFNTAITRALAAPDTLKKSSVDRFGSGVADALLYAFYIGMRVNEKPLLPVLPGQFEKWKDLRSIPDKTYNALKNLPDEYNKYIEGLVPAFTYFQEDLKRREVGKVLSYAAPGKGVDVLFGSS
jgi:hypothetical protein